jgi:hypothetical protein
MKTTLIAALIVLGFSILTFAQDADVAKLREASAVNMLGSRPAASPYSLIDLSRMKWNHSYSISFVSGGEGSGSVGMLRSTMFYELSSKLWLQVDLNLLHNTGAIFGEGSGKADLLPGFRLDYRPSDNFSMSIGINQSRWHGVLSPYYFPRYGLPIEYWTDGH